MKIGEHNILHPSVKYGKDVQIGDFCTIAEGCEIGDGTVIRSYVELRKNTIIGEKCYIDSGVKTSGDCKIGNEVTLRYDTIIARDVEVEDRCFLAPQVMTNYSDPKGDKHPGTVIGAGSFIGTNTTIHHGVKICAGTTVGVKSFVNKDITEPGLYLGIPATFKKKPKS